MTVSDGLWLPAQPKEQTYREWAWRFHLSLKEKEMEFATNEDIKAFLTQIAVKGGVSVATQQQALKLERTAWLMAELMHGSGLRLTELLRLCIKDLALGDPPARIGDRHPDGAGPARAC